MFEPKDKSFDKDSLQTPRYIFDWLNSKYNFDVDLCASDDHHFCDKYYTKENSCLNQIWEPGGVGFCNPPYSDIDPFIDLAIQYASWNFTTVFLIPDFNGEARFDKIPKHAKTIIHLIGRISFIRPDTGEAYVGNNRGSCIIEFSKKYWNLPPQHYYANTKLIDKGVIND